MKQEGGSRRKLSKRRIQKPRSASTSSRAIRLRRCSTTCAAWPTGGSRRCRCPRRWPRRSGSPSAAPRAACRHGQARRHLRDYVATLPGEQILAEVTAWAGRYDPDLATVLETERERALRALSIERDGVANPRKDLRKWADFRAVYGYFFPALFDLVTDRRMSASPA